MKHPELNVSAIARMMDMKQSHLQLILQVQKIHLKNVKKRYLKQ